MFWTTHLTELTSQIWKKLLTQCWKPSNPIKKWAGSINRFFLKEEIQMTSNLEKEGSPLLATREVGVKALRYHTSSQNSNEPKVKTHTSGRMWFITDGKEGQSGHLREQCGGSPSSPQSTSECLYWKEMLSSSKKHLHICESRYRANQSQSRDEWIEKMERTLKSDTYHLKKWNKWNYKMFLRGRS